MSRKQYGGNMQSRMILFLCLFLSINSAWSKTTDYFQKRFKFVRQEGKIVSVIDNSISMKFGIKPYINYIKEKIKTEQEIMNGSLDYDASVLSLFEEEHAISKKDSKYIEYLVKSLKELPKVDVEKVFNNPAFIEVLTKFESKLSEVMTQIDPRILARPQDQEFFVKKKRTYQVLLWGLNFAKKKLSHIPLLNTASYIMVEVEKMVRTRREFHQNMFLHYLHSFKESQLGLSATEANHIFSSIYESRIPWYAFWESAKASANWEAYGARSFYAGVRNANTRLRQSGTIYNSRGIRNTFSFQEVNFEGQDIVINLFDNEGMLHKTPAVAFSKTEPKKIQRKRLLLQLGGLGVSFLPISGTIKDFVSNGLKSYYEKQMITEGALYGYFESNEEAADLEQLKSQYLNPFETL